MNITIWGTGNIAHKIAATIIQMKDFNLYSVISRSYERAKNFAKKFGIPNFTNDMTHIRDDTNIDLIYIATPHSEHYRLTKYCLNNHKNVLCEKPLTINAAQANELIYLSHRNHCLLAEAMWTRYMPSRFLIDNLLSQGLIGTLSSITANLGYPLQSIPRLMSPSLAGGALLDLAVYPIHFANMILNSKVNNVFAKGIKNSNGIDLKESILIFYENDLLATITSDITAYTDRYGVISGSKGYLVVEPINNCKSILHYNSEHRLVKIYQVPYQISGYEYEFLACKKAIENNKIECKEAPHAETLKVLKILDTIRLQLDITFLCEN